MSISSLGYGVNGYGGGLEVQHSTVTVDRGDTTETAVVFGAAPSEISVASGVTATPTVVLGPVPQCKASTANGDRCKRNADWRAGERTCWQHDASDIPDEGWPRLI